MSNKKSYAVFGLGRYGLAAARELSAAGAQVLAVDADANSNLNEVLGVEVEATLGDIREEIARARFSCE